MTDVLTGDAGAMECATCGHEWEVDDDDGLGDIRDANGTVLQNGDTVVLVKNLPLKGNRFDFEPGRENFDIPEDCGVYVGGGAEVKLENINTRQWKVVRE